MSYGIQYFLLLIFLFSGVYVAAQEQEVKTELSPKTMQLNEGFSVRVMILNSKDYEAEGFPEIKGFRKNSKSIAHNQVVQQGRKVIQHTITQNYTAITNGIFIVPAFDLKINGREVRIEEFTLTVGEKNESSGEFTEKENVNSALVSRTELILSHSRPSAFVGEGIKITLGFYIPESNTTPWEFLPAEELNTEIEKIAKALKPKECLENRLPITNIEGTEIITDDHKVIFYKLFEAVYYPLSSGVIRFPPVRLPMVRNLGENNTPITEFKSKAVSVMVNPLPEHPRKDKVAAGKFILEEVVPLKILTTGKSFEYTLKISGEGNFNAVNFDELTNDAHFDFFPPQIMQHQNGGAQLGEKTFIFKILPKDSGAFDLGNYFHWIYFNTARKSYDTLKSGKIIEVSGEVLSHPLGSSGDLFEGIDVLSTSAPDINYRKIIKNISNAAVILMLAGVLYLLNFKRKTKVK